MHLAVAEQSLPITRLRIDLDERGLTDIVGGHDELAAIEARRDMTYRAIPVGGKRAHFVVFAATQHHDVTIGLKARA